MLGASEKKTEFKNGGCVYVNPGAGDEVDLSAACIFAALVAKLYRYWGLFVFIIPFVK